MVRREYIDRRLPPRRRVLATSLECRAKRDRPGIGKSRLARVFCDQLAAEPCGYFSFQCVPNRQDSPFHPLIAHVELAVGLADGDGPEEKLARVEQWVERELAGEADAVKVFAKLLSVPLGERYAPLELEPQAFKNLAFELLIRFLAGYLEEDPAIVVAEDVQWIDPTTQEFLDILVERAAAWPLLLVCTCRPEYRAQWIGGANVTFLNLRRLDSAHSAALAEKVAGGLGLPQEVEAEIVAKTDGVPLFLEELTRTVLESGSLQRDGHSYTLDPSSEVLGILPTTLLGSLLARLDRLAGAQQVAPVGAAIGRTFGYALLRQVVDLEEEELQAVLARLVEAQLLAQRGRPPEATYTFKHGLIQDAAHETMPRGRRSAVHRRIATALVEHFPALAASRPEILAYHYAQANAPEAACEFWCKRRSGPGRARPTWRPSRTSGTPWSPTSGPPAASDRSPRARSCGHCCGANRPSCPSQDGLVREPAVARNRALNAYVQGFASLGETRPGRSINHN